MLGKTLLVALVLTHTFSAHGTEVRTVRTTFVLACFFFVGIFSTVLARLVDFGFNVGFDQLESGRLAAEHALKRGGDSILLVSSPTLFGTSWRSSAFSDYCLQHGVNLEHSTISADTSIRAGYELGKALVRSNRLKKVICCTYDMTALGLTTALCTFCSINSGTRYSCPIFFRAFYFITANSV